VAAAVAVQPATANVALAGNSSSGRTDESAWCSCVLFPAFGGFIQVGSSDELSRFELDSHDDTCCFGSNCIFFNQSNVTVDVTPFLKGLGKAENVGTGSCAVAYDDFETGEVVILVFHQVIYFGNRMDGALGCPNQLRLNGLIVRDCPRHLDPTPDELSHTIQHPAVNLVIPLSCDSVISYFIYRKPTDEEFRSCPKLEMTSDGAVWDPYSPTFADHERVVNPSMVSFFRGDSLFGSVTTSTPWTCDVNDFVAKLPLTVRIDSLAMGRRKGTLTPEILANRWHISLDRAKETLEATTHLAVRERGPNMPSIRLRPLSRQLQFRHLACEMFVDLAVMKVTLLRGNRYALVVHFLWVDSCVPIEEEVGCARRFGFAASAGRCPGEDGRRWWR
jgi:hypothetical protein